MCARLSEAERQSQPMVSAANEFRSFVHSCVIVNVRASDQIERYQSDQYTYGKCPPDRSIPHPVRYENSHAETAVARFSQ